MSGTKVALLRMDTGAEILTLEKMNDELLSEKRQLLAAVIMQDTNLLQCKAKLSAAPMPRATLRFMLMAMPTGNEAYLRMAQGLVVRDLGDICPLGSYSALWEFAFELSIRDTPLTPISTLCATKVRNTFASGETETIAACVVLIECVPLLAINAGSAAIRVQAINAAMDTVLRERVQATMRLAEGYANPAIRFAVAMAVLQYHLRASQIGSTHAMHVSHFSQPYLYVAHDVIPPLSVDMRMEVTSACVHVINTHHAMCKMGIVSPPWCMFKLSVSYCLKESTSCPNKHRIDYDAVTAADAHVIEFVYSKSKRSRTSK
ncbi:hypothetical protein JKP88DRAFT_289511 [Tribonema minus]|uniref:Uncharacterized protein n=1 Tax=Tribonema minus TaxID=303371 RepID=A0A836CIP2_9STRA|nr:hypothetical protein JKP88DRAFT_291192 [Tribonema minus]KAG5185036.1 hypothetical protein JKP88DRAFT_289511 [Tribonema minus]